MAGIATLSIIAVFADTRRMRISRIMLNTASESLSIRSVVRLLRGGYRGNRSGHVDGRVDSVNLDRFIASYQTIKPLKLGELWAIPIVLQLALIENLRRVAARVTAGRRDRDLADDWAERMVRVVDQNSTNLILVRRALDRTRRNPRGSGKED
jgi:hypothetical protein